MAKDLSLLASTFRDMKRIKVLISKPGIDGHWRGAMVVALALRGAGMEVIFGGNQTPEEIVKTAIREDVDIIGLSILAASHTKLVPQVMRLLRETGIQDILVLVGGTIPQEDIPKLKAGGVSEIFLPGTKTEDIVRYIQSRLKEK